MTISSKLRSYLSQHDIEIDDVRWHCCRDLSSRLLSYKDDPQKLTHLLWSGTLEAELYKIEEQFLAKLDEDLSERRIDESQINGLLGEISRSKQKRFR